MLENSQAFSGFAVSDIAKAKEFYGTTLGLKVDESPQGLELHLGSGASIFVYPKPDHQPATFTILNFSVADIDAAVDGLTASGISMEKYDNMPTPLDNKGILRNDDPARGPRAIAWFRDPAGNILSVLQD